MTRTYTYAICHVSQQTWDEVADVFRRAGYDHVFSQRDGDGGTIIDMRGVALQVDPTKEVAPIPLVLFCPRCQVQHIDAPAPEKNWYNPPHRSHECQACGCIWRPADVPTAGVVNINTRGKRDTITPDGHPVGHRGPFKRGASDDNPTGRPNGS